jgi:S1-C subfamily serine protease
MKSPAFISKGLAVVLALTITGGDSRATSLLQTMNEEVSALYEKARTAVVRVHAELPAALTQAALGPRHRIGSGFLVDAEGRLVTAATLVEGAETFQVEWQDRRVEAILLGRDRATNLALLEVDPDECLGPGQTLPHLSFGNSDEQRVGSMVVAIGYPYDQPSAPVVGFVTGLDIQCGGRVFPVTHIRAGLRLRPGQGGGPLLNPRGEVVGLVVASHREDQCYALPARAIQKVIRDILDRGEPQHGWVGLSVGEQPVTNQSGAVAGWRVTVQSVLSNTPAAAAGFQAQDVVVKIGTNPIHRAADVLNTMFYRRCGETLSLTLLRDGRTQEVHVAVGKRPARLPEDPWPRPPAGGFLQIVPAARRQ